MVPRPCSAETWWWCCDPMVLRPEGAETRMCWDLMVQRPDGRWCWRPVVMKPDLFIYLFIYLLIRHFWVTLAQWPVANLKRSLMMMIPDRTENWEPTTVLHSVQDVWLGILQLSFMCVVAPDAPPPRYQKNKEMRTASEISGVLFSGIEWHSPRVELSVLYFLCWTFCAGLSALDNRTVTEANAVMLLHRLCCFTAYAASPLMLLHRLCCFTAYAASVFKISIWMYLYYF